jgi:hypothetical protein
MILFLFFFILLLTNLLPEGVLRSLQAYQISGSKLHLVGTLKRSFFDIINISLMRKEKLQKNEVKTAVTRFRQIEIIYFFVILKIIT